MKGTSPRRRLSWPALLAALVFVLIARSAAQAIPVVGLTRVGDLAQGNDLVIFDSARPGLVFHRVKVTGLVQAGEALIGIDYRPADGRLYGVSTRSRVYRVDPLTGAASQVGSQPFSPPLDPDSFAVHAGFDIDPVTDKIRLINCFQNLRISPETGAVVGVDAAPKWAAGQQNAGQGLCPLGAAYSNNFQGAPTTTLYAINPPGNDFMIIGSLGGAPDSANTGLTRKVGEPFPSRPHLQELTAFDIAPGRSNVAFASMTSAESIFSDLYSIDLSNGKAYRIGPIGGEAGAPLFGLTGLTILPPGGNLFAVTLTNKLLLFNSAVPGVAIFSRNILGLPAGEDILAIDFRPADGRLYALGSGSRLYRIDDQEGQPRAVQVGDAFTPALDGAHFGFDFNPLTDRLRVTSDTGQSLIVNPDTGAATGALAPLAYAAGDPNAGQSPKVVGSAFSHATSGPPPGAILYGIDFGRNALVAHEAPDSSTLRTVGPLDLFLTSGNVGFDILPGNTGTAYAALSPLCFEGCPTPSTLFTISLTAGRAQVVGGIGGGEQVRALAAVPQNAFFFNSVRYETFEGTTAVTVVVLRSGDVTVPASVDYETGPALSGNPADPRADYNSAYGTLRFNFGESLKTFTVLVNDDSHVERTEHDDFENLSVLLTNPTAGFVTGKPNPSVVIIRETEEDTSVNRIDVTDNFVKQHYHDFLNREADLPGLIFWTLNIESCATAACRDAKRIETSAAFFFSIEFQETGYLVYRFHETAFDTGERLALRDFLTDTQRIGRDFIVGQTGWEQKIESNKHAYAQEFVIRPAFLARYPLTMPASEFVDALNQNAGGVLTQVERDDLVAKLNSGALSRAQVLRAIAEDEDLRRKEFNRAFVLMQYFGYLRRNPSEPPDGDFEGFNFWLKKLNEHNGDWRRAEMVKAFLTSTEYRKRFGKP